MILNKWGNPLLLASLSAILLACFSVSLNAQEDEFFPAPKARPAAPDKQQIDEKESALGESDSLFFPPEKTRQQDKLQAQQAQANAPLPANLTRTVKRKLDTEVFPALNEDRTRDFLNSMGELVSKQNREGLAAIEEYSQAHGISIRDKFASILVNAIEQQEQIPVPDLKIDVVEYLNRGLRKRIDSELEELARHPVMAAEPQLPGDWRKTEQLFWEVHVWRNRLANVRRLSEYAKTIQQHLFARAKKKNDVPAMNRLEPTVMLDFKVQQYQKKMLEGETLLRIAELEKADEALRSSQDFEERISAAFALEMHGHFLKETFTNYPPGSFDHARLNDPELVEHCGALLKSGRASGTKVIAKSLLLRRGAHWWFRGRYGSGTLVYGLLKDRKAMNSEDEMFKLYMPKERPQPIGMTSSDNSVSPGYDRRHYYTWAVEKRDLVSGHSRSATGPATVTVSSSSTDNYSQKTSFY